MSLITLALIPLLPLVAAAVTALMKNGKWAAGIAIASLLSSCGIALWAFSETWISGNIQLETYSTNWLTIGETKINFGFILDPLTGAMAAMVTFVGSLIFIYSAGYMAQDNRMARFFC